MLSVVPVVGAASASPTPVADIVVKPSTRYKTVLKN
jgi:hypothetical protein